jgi:dTDP-4-dehydrorhamnose reductase
MKVLIFGGNGMLGHKLVQQLQNRFEVWTTLRSKTESFESLRAINSDNVIYNVEVENFGLVQEIVFKLKPDAIINAVGIIKQLPTSKDVIKILKINSIFPHQLAQLAEVCGFRLINISTDCVFNGRKGNYKEEDVADAEDLYGKSKNLGEVVAANCLTLRTSIIGRELGTSHSLVEWFLSNRGGKVRGFTNAIYTGFPTVILAEIIADLLENFRDLNGLYHVSSEPINKFDLLNLVREYYKVEIQIEPDDDFRIDRSLDSTKFRKETGFAPLKWEKMVEIMAEDKTPYDKIREKFII